MWNLQLLSAKFAAHVRAAGLLHALSEGVRHAIRQGATMSKAGQDEFDVRYGTDTGGSLNLWTFRIRSRNAAHGVSYGSASEQHIRVLLDPLPRSASFVDLGCGKGRPLLVAAQMQFTAVIGVEFVPDLAEVAHANICKVGIAATVICADAADYEFPSGPLVVYLYNPFDSVVMSRVAEKLQRHRGDLWVLYINPRHDDLFQSWMEYIPLSAVQATMFSQHSVSVWHKPCSTR